MDLELAALSQKELIDRIDAAHQHKNALLDELDRRKTVARMERLEKLRVLLKPEIIDAMIPTHERTSCDDGYRKNGFNGERVRCARCAFLEAMDSGCFDAGYDVSISFHFPRAGLDT